MPKARDVATSKTDYDESFYLRQQEGSEKLAVKITEHLTKFYKPKTIIDIGCGRGSWLSAFADENITKRIGVDGPWNSQNDMLDQRIQFFPSDLAHPENITVEGRFDLAMSLEVAEHLPPESSNAFVKALVKYSDVILFSAAYEHQGGNAHINERKHSFWAELFAHEGYVPFDLFRPVFWGDPDVRFWYQQNCFLYVEKNSKLISDLEKRNVTPLKNLQFMNCINPRLYARYTKPPFIERGMLKLKAKVRNMIKGSQPE